MSDEKVPDAVIDEKPFEDTLARHVVLGAMGIEGEQNEVALISVRVEAFTVEAKIQPRQYEQSRVYASFVPENLYIHVPVTNPGQLVDNAGNVGILGKVMRYLASEVERTGFRIASERVDRRTVEQDKQDEKKGGVKLGNAPKRSEVL